MSVDIKWQERAKCVGQPVDLFFPGQGESSRPGKAICKGCPVTVQCLRFALQHEEPGCRHGIYGGLTGGERSMRIEWRG